MVRSTQPRTPLFVRLPADQATRLDAVAAKFGASKQDLVSGLLARCLEPVVPAELPIGTLQLPTQAGDILLLDEVAAFLRAPVEAVLERVEAGDLPARRLAGEWRFSRRAVLDWLGGSDATARKAPGFGG